MSTINVIVEVWIPDGATYYAGSILDEPLFYKCKMIADYPHWFEYNRERKEWLLYKHGHDVPHHAAEIKEMMNVRIKRLQEIA